jgi:hypothetical protein
MRQNVPQMIRQIARTNRVRMLPERGAGVLRGAGFFGGGVPRPLVLAAFCVGYRRSATSDFPPLPDVAMPVCALLSGFPHSTRFGWECEAGLRAIRGSLPLKFAARGGYGD